MVTKRLYRVVYDENLLILQVHVNGMMAKGWIPQGGISAFRGVGYMQAMTYPKGNYWYDKKKEKPKTR